MYLKTWTLSEGIAVVAKKLGMTSVKTFLLSLLCQSVISDHMNKDFCLFNLGLTVFQNGGLSLAGSLKSCQPMNERFQGQTHVSLSHDCLFFFF